MNLPILAEGIADLDSPSVLRGLMAVAFVVGLYGLYRLVRGKK